MIVKIETPSNSSEFLKNGAGFRSAAGFNYPTHALLDAAAGAVEFKMPTAGNPDRIRAVTIANRYSGSERIYE